MSRKQGKDSYKETELSPLLERNRQHRRVRNLSGSRSKTTEIRPPNLPSHIIYKKPQSLSFKNDTDSAFSIGHFERNDTLPPQTWTGAAQKVINGWVERGQKPTLRQQLSFYIDTSRLGRLWDILDFLINLLLVCIYLWNTRYVKEENREQLLPRNLFLIEWSLALSLFIQWLPRIYVSPDIFDYLASSYSIVTIAATAPPIVVPLVDYFSSSVDLSRTYMAAGTLVYLYPFRFLRLHLSFCILLLPVKNAYFHLSLIQKKTLQLCSTILFNICFVSAWIHIVTYKLHERDEKIRYISFFDAFFFTTISSTSGFNSNLVPDSVINRVLILYIMVSGALFLPGKISELLALINKRSPFDRSFEPERNQQHVIICGDFDNNSLFEFLREFFCEDHGLQTMNTNVVILNSSEPSDELKNMLNDPAYLNRVQYVKGLPTSYRSLKKVRAQKAKACFVLTNRFAASDDREADANAVMLALAIKRFSKSMKIYAKVNLPENKPHFDQLARQLICIQELRMGLLAQNTVNPGFATMICLLSTSMTDATCDELTFSIESNSELEWLEEYIHGATHEIYPIKFSKCFVGMKFISAVEHIYKYFGATLFAINIIQPEDSRNSKKKNIFLNPSLHVINGTETGYIMSSSAYDANRISTLGEEGNSFDEYSCIFKEELEPMTDNAELMEEPESEDSSASSKSRSRPPLLRSQTKESEVSDVPDVMKSNLVIQSDESAEESGNDEKEPVIKKELLEAPSASSSRDQTLNVPSETSLSFQERNINKVISEMMKENTYFDAVSSISKISGHVVVCDSSDAFPCSMEYFVGSLRASHLDEYLPIVILSVAPPSDNQRYLLEQFGDVHFLAGSPLSRKSLFAAGVSRARKGIVLCDGKIALDNTERTVDASSLLTVLNMESMALDPNFFVVVEFIYRENMKLVGVSETIIASESYAQALLRPAFMAGHVVAPCMLEPLICQAYYNDDFLAVIDRLVFDSSLDKWRRVGGCGEGGAPTPSQDALGSPGSLTSHLFTFPLPSVFVGRPYFHLLAWLLSEKRAVPLGIYRTRAFKNRQICYVVTNPKPDGLLLASDKIYLLADKMI